MSAAAATTRRGAGWELEPPPAASTMTTTRTATATAPATSQLTRDLGLSSHTRALSGLVTVGARRRRSVLRRVSRRQIEALVLVEHRALNLGQSRARLDAELVEQLAPRALEALEGVHLAARPVQRDHQLLVEALAQGMLVHERLELGHERRMAAQREVRLDPALERGDPRLLEARNLRLGKSLIREVGEDWSAPEPQRRFQQGARLAWLASLKCLLTLRSEFLEPVAVDLVGFDHEQIATPAGD
jgi:hypothetical protein